MTVAEVRKRYLDFFAQRGHAIIPSAPIVPENDPTTLFTSSGMQPLVPYLLGQPHPEGTRLADAQTSFRAEDIEEVGDNRHTTFFEMLGNWSLGDYGKKEEIPWLYEFLTRELLFPPEKLWVTCFEGDESLGISRDNESAEIWQSLGIPQERIRFYPARKNWWSRSGIPANMPTGEIGGPDTEVFYDFGTSHDPAFGETCHQNCDCGRFVEIGNAVFITYKKTIDGSFEKLAQQNVDFGGGLERLAFAAIANPDIFMIDVFDEARHVLETKSGQSYENAIATRSFRIILDHIRAAAFFIASGIRPSNTEQGYILRRLIRRSIREADKLGITEPVLAAVADGFGKAYEDAYPFVLASAAAIKDELEKEEAQFRKTLTQGLREFERMGQQIDAFILFTTYGFPVELTVEIAAERGISIDLRAVEQKMAEHQARSRASAAQKFAGGLADHAEQTIRYHTAHHLLLKALQMVLGPEVHQRGSNITSERLRIDFSYGQKMTDEQKTEVEKIVNEKIRESIPVLRTDMPKEEAEKLGAEHEFGATYPDTVSVYSVGPLDNAFSIEYCGGPHVANTSELGEGGKKFRIMKEEASSSGVRRIKAVLE
ncbi:alanine--tRNA ligase [Candidatus Kaiserbacteria bacterium CG10_big_fil_rev_8_21_14_0_10_56_12]|uniref:alanine--tRNA ligase n=1 Tax=Candidatus Kaiserbacteria bacterium CG10_big_fil_rev_8_21_14_0_10_56_12 TaxID=1974611 RepID=A0A2H0UA47_9BACT|nr:MAG: alanine--tRNA ligase [Candidatus Kaiserbacteria bacterium CG10_big_fil_rev_8_21_14_0_10_56_12]